MSTTPDAGPVHSCAGCGASIYREHLDRGLAGYRAGKMLCRYCIAEVDGGSSPTPSAQMPPVGRSGSGAPIAGKSAVMPALSPGKSGVMPAQAASGEPDVELESLPLDEPVAAPASRSSAVTVGPTVAAAAAAAKAQVSGREREFKRPLNPAGAGATRVRTFHSKLSDGAVHHLDELINEWLDTHPDVEIKFATTTVGVFEGKHAEPNLIVTLYY